MRTRLLIALALMAASLAVIFALAFVSVRLCMPPPLTGDELWTFFYQLRLASAAVLNLSHTACFTADGLGLGLWSVVEFVRPLPAMILVAVVFWEVLGWRLRLAWLRRSGSHVLLAGMPDLIATLPGDVGPRVWLVQNPQERRQAIRAHPFRQIVDLSHRAGMLDKVGVRTAGLIIAASDVDTENLALADAAVSERSSAEVLVRIERPVSRALFSDDLRARASTSGVQVLCLSFSQMAQRAALELAMPGRYVDERTTVPHIVIAGEGPDVVEMADLVARQGYGVESAPPLLSILALDAALALHPTLERLQDAGLVVRVVVHHAEAQDREGIDQAMLRIMQDNPPITAIHCAGVKQGEATGLALRWERLFLARRAIVPPIVALDQEGRPGSTGMIRVASPPDLSQCRATSARLDLHAKAAHEAYIEGRKQARGAEFGSLPAEKEWDDLPERFRDDNRAFADHIDYKLSLAGLVVGKDAGAPSPDPANHPRLAEIEHARWMSARIVDRWHYGELRDDAARIHPDIKPFAELDGDARQKDTDLISSLITVLHQCGEALFAEITFALDEAWTPDMTELKTLLDRLREWQADNPSAFPVLRVLLNDPRDLKIARHVVEAGFALEAVLDPQTFPYTDPAMAGVLRKARRIRVVSNVARGDVPHRAQDLMKRVREEA